MKTALQEFIEWGDEMMMKYPIKELGFGQAIDKAQELLDNENSRWTKMTAREINENYIHLKHIKSLRMLPSRIINALYNNFEFTRLCDITKEQFFQTANLNIKSWDVFQEALGNKL
jgi:hypothetical protein